MASIFRNFLFLALVFSLGGCSPKKDSVPDNDPLIGAQRSIDKGDYDAAIKDLEGRMAGDPDARVRETLASAYAARAGLHVEKYWGFLSGFRAPVLNNDSISKSPSVARADRILKQLDEGTANDEGRALGNLAEFFGTLEIWSARIETLPVVRDGARKDVEKAIQILTDIPTRGGRLYRALLGLVIFKSDVTVLGEGWEKVEKHLKKFDFRNPISIQNKLLLCQIDVKAFAAKAGHTVERLVVTGRDVGAAFPSKAKDMESALTVSAAVAKQLISTGEGSCF